MITKNTTPGINKPDFEGHLGSSYRFRVQRSAFRVQGAGCRVQGLKQLTTSWGILFLTCLLFILVGCGQADYSQTLSGTNEVLILKALQEIEISGAENIFLKISKKIFGQENSPLYQAFYKISAKRVIKDSYLPVLESLTTPAHSPKVRIQAIRTIGKIKAWEASERLKELLKDDDPEVVRKTIITIAMLDQPDFINDLKPLLNKPEFSTYAIWCLGEIGTVKEDVLIAPFLKSEQPTVALVAYKALSQLE